MLGINTNIGGGIYRTANNMDRVNTAFQRSLERLETGSKVNRASDDPTAYATALSLTTEINAIDTQILSNMDTIAELEKMDAAQTSVLKAYQDMKDAAEALADTTDAVAQAGHLATIQSLEDSINALTLTEYDGGANALGGGAGAAQTLTFGAGGESITHTFGNIDTDGAALAGMTGTITADIAAVAAAAAGAAAATAAGTLATDLIDWIGNVMGESGALGATKNQVFENAQQMLNTEKAGLVDFRNSIVSVNEAEESAVLTSLQMRQQRKAGAKSLCLF
ncbi:MAG: flagellin [Planctomycetota bacterium]|jgi:flagellin